MGLDEMADTIGIISAIERAGSGNERIQRKACKEATIGKNQSGYAAHFRHCLLQYLYAKTPALDNIMRSALHEVPHLIETDAMKSTEGRMLLDLLHDEGGLGGMKRFFLDRFASPLENFVETTSAFTLQNLLHTHAVQSNTPKDVVLLLLETMIGIHQSIMKRITVLLPTPCESKALIGLPNDVMASISMSILSRCLRVLFRSMQGLQNEIEAIQLRKVEKMYAIPKDMRFMFEDLQNAKNRLKAGGLDAMSHVALGSTLPLVPQGLQEKPGKESRQESGTVLLTLCRPEGIYFCREERASDNKKMTVVMSMADDKDETGNNAPAEAGRNLHISDANAQFSVLNGQRTFVSEFAEFAGMSYDLLPPGAEQTVRNLTANVQMELGRILATQPLLAKNTGHFRQLEFRTFGDSNVHIACEKENEEVLKGLLNGHGNAVQYLQLKHSSAFIVSDHPVAASSPQETERETVLANPPLTVEGIFAGTQIEQLQFSRLNWLLLKLGMVKEADQGKGSHTKYINPVSKKFSILSHRFTRSHTTEIKAGILITSFCNLQLTQQQLERLQELVSDL